MDDSFEFLLLSLLFGVEYGSDFREVFRMMSGVVLLVVDVMGWNGCWIMKFLFFYDVF